MADQPVPQLNLPPWLMPPGGGASGIPGFGDYSNFAGNTGFGYNNIWDQMNDAFRLPTQGGGVFMGNNVPRYGRPAPTGVTFPATNGNYTGMFNFANPQGQGSPQQIGYNGGGGSGLLGPGPGGPTQNTAGAGSGGMRPMGGGGMGGPPMAAPGGGGTGLLGRTIDGEAGMTPVAQYNPATAGNSGVPNSSGGWGQASDPLAYYRQAATPTGTGYNGGQNLGNIQPAYSAGTINNMQAGGNAYNPVAQSIGQYLANAQQNATIDPASLQGRQALADGSGIMKNGQLTWNTDPAFLQQMAQRNISQLDPTAQQQWNSWASNLGNFQG